MSFGGCLSTLIAQLSQTNLQLATTLDFWQKQYDIRDGLPGQDLELLGGVDLGALSFQESVLDNAPLNTRAGLYIYLNAMVTIIRHPPNTISYLAMLKFLVVWTSYLRRSSSG